MLHFKPAYGPIFAAPTAYRLPTKLTFWCFYLHKDDKKTMWHAQAQPFLLNLDLLCLLGGLQYV